MAEKGNDMVVSDRNRKFVKYLLLILAVIAFDQVTKWIVTATIPMWNEGPVLIGNDFLRLVHIRNKAAGFGLGSSLSGFARFVFIYFVPCALMAYLLYLLYRGEEAGIRSELEKISFCLIIGGGIGNLIDRTFRPSGVVDFIDVKFYGIFGMDRWPAFNMADSCVVVGAILLVISTIFVNRVCFKGSSPVSSSSSEVDSRSNARLASDERKRGK